MSARPDSKFAERGVQKVLDSGRTQSGQFHGFRRRAWQHEGNRQENCSAGVESGLRRELSRQEIRLRSERTQRVPAHSVAPRRIEVGNDTAVPNRPDAGAGKDVMLSLEVRKRSGGAEVYRLDGGAVTVGASSGNEVVVRARGVAGRHVRISERADGYHLDLYKGAEAVNVNGQEFQGGVISAGDRIRIGEATITVLGGAARLAPRPAYDQDLLAARPVAVPVLPATEVEYRALRLQAYRVCRESGSVEELATELTEFLDRELPPSEWAVGELSAAAGFRPVASTFRESPALPPRLLEEARGGAGVARFESVTGLLTLIPEPECGTDCLALLVRESPKLAARAVLFLEELAAVAGIAFRARLPTRAEPAAPAAAETTVAAGAPDASEAASVLRQTDDLKKIVETVEREVIDRAMRRVQGNQSRGSQVLNISRGSLIAKLKEYGIADYRYLRRQRGKRGS